MNKRRQSAARTALKRDIVAGSHLFDREWYLGRYPDVAIAGVDAALHYVRHGAAEGREPGPGFDGRWYLQRYPDVAAARLNPLLHYIMHGAAEGRETRRPGAATAGAGVPEPDLTAEAANDIRARHLGLHLAPSRQAAIAVGVVTYNTPTPVLQRVIRYTVSALARVGAPTSGNVLLLDNGSSSEAAVADNPAIRRLAPRGNIGFGAGHNALMETAFSSGAALYIAINPDGLLHPDAVKALHCMVQAAGGCALVEAAQFPEEHPKIYNQLTFDTPWASGACIAVPRTIFEATSGFDETFFMYCEDVDLSWRVRAAGFTVKTCPLAIFYHPIPKRDQDGNVRTMMLRAGIILIRKWGGPLDLEKSLEAELANLGSPPPVYRPPQVPPEHRWVADFAHGFHFAPPRW